MKSIKNILLIPLQVIETHIISFFSTHSFGYAFQKELQSVFQALTNNFNIRFKRLQSKNIDK